jgi:hypothetical protein
VQLGPGLGIELLSGDRVWKAGPTRVRRAVAVGRTTPGSARRVLIGPGTGGTGPASPRAFGGPVAASRAIRPPRSPVPGPASRAGRPSPVPAFGVPRARASPSAGAFPRSRGSRGPTLARASRSVAAEGPGAPSSGGASAGTAGPCTRRWSPIALPGPVRRRIPTGPAGPVRGGRLASGPAGPVRGGRPACGPAGPVRGGRPACGPAGPVGRRRPAGAPAGPVLRRCPTGPWGPAGWGRPRGPAWCFAGRSSRGAPRAVTRRSIATRAAATGAGFLTGAPGRRSAAAVVRRPAGPGRARASPGCLRGPGGRARRLRVSAACRVAALTATAACPPALGRSASLSHTNLQHLPPQYPDKRRGPLDHIGSDPLQTCPAASYSPTRSPAQYHRR